MKRFFFHVSKGAEISYDVTGFDFPDLQTAAREAAVTLGEMAKDELQASDQLNLTIEVHNEAGQQLIVARILFEIAINV